MSELVSMLVPLQTLAGWPEAPTPSPLAVLGLLVGFPALAFVVAIAVAKIGNAAHARQGTATEAADPVWVGGRDSAALEAAPSTEDEGSQAVGGAGARW